jgi:hypothetical protein
VICAIESDTEGIKSRSAELAARMSEIVDVSGPPGFTIRNVRGDGSG